MAFTTEEQALRSALHDATLVQPEAPVDRLPAVRRRHVHRRRLQSVAAAAAVVVVAAGAVVVSGGIGASNQAEPLNRQVPSWALPWADHRDGSVPQKVLDTAVRGWVDKQRADAPLPASQPVQMAPVVWYLGEHIRGTGQVLAVFEVGGLHAGALPLTKGPRLVVAQAAWDDVPDPSGKATSGWTFLDRPAPPHDYRGYLGGYLAVTANDPVHNVAWLLTSPSYRRAQTSVGSRHLTDGFTTFDAGVLRTQVEVSIEDSHGRYPAGGYLGIPGAPSTYAPTLANVASLTGLPNRATMIGEAWAQGDTLGDDQTVPKSVGRPTTIYARCYSAGPAATIRVAIDRDSARRGARIPCDDRQHVVAGNRTGYNRLSGGGGHSYVVQASDLTAWTVAIVLH